MSFRWQACIAGFLVLLFRGGAWADAVEQLRSEARALAGRAVVRPYGAALAEPITETVDAAALPKGAQIVGFQARGTPAAGWILARAAKLTGDRELDEAARKIARAIAAAQESSGRIPPQAVFGASSVSQKRPPGNPSDRSATTACLGFLLAYLPDHAGDELSRRCAMRAAQWLMREQTATGVWVTTVDHPEKKSLKLIRLDTPDFRDGVFALTLGAETLREPGLRRGASKAVDLLIRIRIDPSRTAGGLWRAVYYLDGSPCDLFDDGAGVDVLASRYAMQAMLCQAMAHNNAAAEDAFRRAATTIFGLKYEDDLWRRVYLLKDNEVVDMPRGLAPQRQTVLDAQRPDPDQITWQTGDFGIQHVVRLAAPAQRPRTGSLDEDITLALVGLTDRPFTFPRPASSAEANAAMEKGRPLWELLDEPVPQGLSDLLGRLSVLVYKVQIQKLSGNSTTRSAASG